MRPARSIPAWQYPELPSRVSEVPLPAGDLVHCQQFRPPETRLQADIYMLPPGKRDHLQSGGGVGDGCRRSLHHAIQSANPIADTTGYLLPLTVQVIETITTP
jgi:hypothetical protein